MVKNNQTKFKETEIGPIPEEWDVVELGQSVEIIDGDRGTNYPNGSDFSDCGYCLFLNTKNVSGDSFDFAECEFITKETDLILRKGKMQRDDFVLTTRGTVGNIAHYDSKVKFDNLRINSGMVILRNINFDNHFLFQFLKSKIARNQFLELASGSAQPQLPIRDLKSLKLIQPSVKEQKNIAEILSSLDDKIESNRRMNATLEKIASAIFKRWFVDFEFPNEEGKPYKSSGGKMVDSEMGEIPEGWEISNLGRVLTFNYGKALKGENRISGNVKVYGSSGFVGFHNEKMASGPGIVIGRKGNVGSVYWVDSDFYPIDTTYFVESKLPLSFCYYLLKNQDFINGDSVVPGLNREQAYLNKIIFPDIKDIEIFSKFIFELRSTISFFEKQNNNLSQIRDSLLPRLMSGKIRT